MPTASEIHTAFLAVARDAEQMAKSMRNFASLYATAEADKSTAETYEDDGTKKRKRRQVKLVDPRRPEKAQSAYNHFIKENYNRAREEDEADNRGVMTVLAKEWKELSADEKKKYQEMAGKDKERFDREMKEFAAYREVHPYDEATEGTSAASKKQKRKLASASQTSPSADSEDELQKSSDEEEQPAKEQQEESAKALKDAKKKADKKEKKAKAGNEKNDQAKDGKKKRRNSKSKKPVTKGQ